MKRSLDDLSAFVEVAREGSFTRAAARIGVSQSALSHTIRTLEARLGIRLLTRTTRSVAPTQAGERLLATLAPALDGIQVELAALTALRDKPAGIVRINATERPARLILWPALARLLPEYPDIQVEVTVESGFVDIVAGRFDAGVRLGEQIAKDMIAVPIGPELRMACVAAPAYLATRRAPVLPQDLAEHQCINLRLTTAGSVYAWELERDGRELRVRVEGQLTFNSPTMVVDACLAGMGLAFLPEDHLIEPLADGRLVRLMEDWCPPFAGYHLYYPSRRQLSPAFAVVLEALRYRRPH